MKSRVLLATALLLPVFACAQVPEIPKAMPSTDLVKNVSDSVSGSLPSLLQSQLGITQDQAEGGLGSLLSLASENLDAADFNKLKSMIPGSIDYVDAAKKLGAFAGPLKNIEGLNAALAKLGISPEAIAKFVPTVTDAISKLGGGDASKLLRAALGT